MDTLIDKFSKQMNNELRANESKGDFVSGWNPTPYELTAEIAWHMAKLNKALADVIENDCHENRLKIDEYSADIANYMAKMSQCYGTLGKNLK